MDDIQFDWVPDYSNDMLMVRATRQLQVAEQKHWLGLLAKAWREGATAIVNAHPSWWGLIQTDENPYEAMLRSLDG